MPNDSTNDPPELYQLSPKSPTLVDSAILSINDSGIIVGVSSLPGNTVDHAFLYSNGMMQDLGTLGGNESFAEAINGAGVTVGNSDFLVNSNSRHAFLFSNGMMADLGTLGGIESSAQSINVAGWIVGQSSTALDPTTQRAMLYKNSVMYDLNDAIPARSNWLLSSAVDINTRGQIVGRGRFNGFNHSFLLTPQNFDLSPVSFNYSITTKLGTIDNDLLAMDTPFTAVARIHNTGDPLTQSFEVALYLSTDAVIDSADVKVASQTVNGIGGNADLDVEFDLAAGLPTVNIAAALYHGTVSLGYAIDVGNAIVETDETNNSGPNSIRPVRLFDPPAPSHTLSLPADQPYYFSTRAKAEKFLRTNKFSSGFGSNADWSAPFSSSVISYYNGLQMPAAAFYLAASAPTYDSTTRLWHSNRFLGASAVFNPFALSPVVGEPTQPAFNTILGTIQAISVDRTWLHYVSEYHQNF